MSTEQQQQTAPPEPDPAVVRTRDGHCLDFLALRVRDAVQEAGIRVVRAPSCQSTETTDLGVMATPAIPFDAEHGGVDISYDFAWPAVVVRWQTAPNGLDLSTHSRRHLMAGLLWALTSGPGAFRCELRFVYDGLGDYVQVYGMGAL